MKKKFWEIIGYISLIGLIIGQITIGFSFWIGQTAYLISNIIITIRCFAIKQNTSDKVKNIALLSICIGIMMIKLF